jgi:hypothetical protein
MTNAERQTAMTDTGDLPLGRANVVAASGVLSSGVAPERPRRGLRAESGAERLVGVALEHVPVARRGDGAVRHADVDHPAHGRAHEDIGYALRLR